MMPPDDVLGAAPRRVAERRPERWTLRGGGYLELFLGEIVDAPADVLCTSTNERASLRGGTGASVSASAGWGPRREAAALVAGAGGRLPLGSVHRTSAGRLPHAFLLHAVACGAAHASSAEAIRACTAGALDEAARGGAARIALPVFGSGHAGFPFEGAVSAMAEALARARAPLARVVLVLLDGDRLGATRGVLDRALSRVDR